MKAAAGEKTPVQWLETAFDVWGRILDPDSQNIGPLITFKSLMVGSSLIFLRGPDPETLVPP